MLQFELFTLYIAIHLTGQRALLWGPRVCGKVAIARKARRESFGCAFYLSELFDAVFFNVAVDR